MTMTIDGHGPGYREVQTRPSIQDCLATLKKFVNEAASPTVTVQDLLVASRATKDDNAQWWDQHRLNLPADPSDADIDAARTRVGHAMVDEQGATVALRNLDSYLEDGVLGDVGKSGIKALVDDVAKKIGATSRTVQDANIEVYSGDSSRTDWGQYLEYHQSEAAAAQKIADPVKEAFGRGGNPGADADCAAQTISVVTGQFIDAAAAAQALREAGLPVNAPQRQANAQRLQTELVGGMNRVSDAARVLDAANDTSTALLNADRDFSYLYKTSALDAADQHTQAFVQQHIPPGLHTIFGYGSPNDAARHKVQDELLQDGVDLSALGVR
ncbi:hypothetical protein FUT88_15660 [Ralstonia sp. TCR112]|uniref:hypothetical protein n=1 Tax=Ralstonia sp. TCR112 TaxID=2601730 RepID=UPI0011BDB4EE|nr:hypothetical protein [Ralstonia sp. TCR112]TXD57645.1 hypothetical protein FUT88_15660 [Ralstonia sp. TCR112]